MKFKYILLTSISAVFLFNSCIKEDINESEGVLNPEISIYSLRNIYKNNSISLNSDNLNGAKYTAGVVISNAENKNLPEGIVAVQSLWRGQSRGILLKVTEPNKYAFGDSIRIELDGAQLSKENNRLLINNSTQEPVKLATGINKPYVSVSINSLLNDLEIYESQLINITADVDPEPTNGAIFSGAKQIIDGEGKKINLFTETNATFANEKIAPSATFQGIILASDNGPELRLQKAEDMLYPSGKLYPGWPESFEEPYQGKTSYNVTATENLLEMTTGTWWLYQVIQGETGGRDRIVSGLQALRFQQNRSDNEYAQMNFDVPNGASKVTFFYGAYYTDRSSTFQLEYSINQGATWQIVGSPISDAHTTSQSLSAKQAIFLVDIDQPVRFRINKLGLGTSNNTVSNGRLGIDDFAIYQGY